MLPKHFCWSKIGAESGESLELIIKRKELERQSGNGSFFWGIGNSVSKSLDLLSKATSRPIVLFSSIKSQAKEIDKNPAGIALWSHYIDRFGQTLELPINSFITSRFDGKEIDSSKHYALICHSLDSLFCGCDLEIWSEQLNNLATGNKLGFSQVTSTVTVNSKIKPSKAPYKVRFKADLLEPYCVRLALPAKVDRVRINQMNELVSNPSTSSIDWLNWVTETKQRHFSNRPLAHQLHLKITAKGDRISA